jgi:hypothetical protein
LDSSDGYTDGLYVGAVEALLDHKSELKERVGAVVSLLSSSEFNSLKLGTLKKEFKHLWIEIDDMPSCDLKQHFKKAFKFIDKGLKKGTRSKTRNLLTVSTFISILSQFYKIDCLLCL